MNISIVSQMACEKSHRMRLCSLCTDSLPCSSGPAGLRQRAEHHPGREVNTWLWVRGEQVVKNANGRSKFEMDGRICTPGGRFCMMMVGQSDCFGANPESAANTIPMNTMQAFTQ
jgi:hypothetical protein